jgi:chromosome segregation ATPase
MTDNDLSGGDNAAPRSRGGTLRVKRPQSTPSFTVEKVRRRPAPREETPPAREAGVEPSALSNLTAAESAARLTALSEAQSREPEERRIAEEKERSARERDKDDRIALLEQKVLALSDELRAEHDRSMELQQNRDNQQQEIADLQARLNSCYEQIAELVAARQQEREITDRLRADLQAKAAEVQKLMADAAEGIADAKSGMERAEQRFSEYRSRPWWRRMLGWP